MSQDRIHLVQTSCLSGDGWTSPHKLWGGTIDDCLQTDHMLNHKGLKFSICLGWYNIISSRSPTVWNRYIGCILTRWQIK